MCHTCTCDYPVLVRSVWSGKVFSLLSLHAHAPCWLPDLMIDRRCVHAALALATAAVLAACMMVVRPAHATMHGIAWTFEDEVTSLPRPIDLGFIIIIDCFDIVSVALQCSS